MQKGFYFSAILAACLFLLCACAPLPSQSMVESSNESEASGYELIIAKESAVLDSASESISVCFPDVVVSSLSGQEKGFTFSVAHVPDKLMYKFLIKKTFGTTQDGNDIVGYRYYIYADAQLLSPRAAEVHQLIVVFKKTLTEKGGTLVLVKPVKAAP